MLEARANLYTSLYRTCLVRRLKKSESQKHRKMAMISRVMACHVLVVDCVSLPLIISHQQIHGVLKSCLCTKLSLLHAEELVLVAALCFTALAFGYPCGSTLLHLVVLTSTQFHVEAARLLAFTEEDFVKTLDWDSR